ncbi:LysR substrate-binding domain-containing protein [Octadecabacter sp. G9-8]|uniref:LysR substrate-binding domain-containing protein n=1 Tax=Octadecabacter dasysiphoniae TaxID=2909341 RepID=A0ABS9CV85_9RHOB|nr:LysR substrate-binding domain-containing protein [Octadecabacter dasysiphoniae]MCF2870744.1 LysR substrate-binding domain-containing protein [Octadecabacter dasysiphoniae]
MQNLNLNSLRIFAAAARHGNFLLASAELKLSQGAVSQRIKQLELELGLQLFEREARGVSLTKAGQELAQTVEKALGLLEQTTRRIKTFGSEITMHVSPSIARKWLTPRLPRFSRQHPDVQLSIEARADVLARPLHHNEIAMRHGKGFPAVAGQHMSALVEVELIAVCNPDLGGLGPTPDIQRILTAPLIQDTHRRWDTLLERWHTTTLSEPLNFNSASLAIDAAVNGQGVAIVPSLFVQDDIAAGRLRKIWTAQDPSGEHLFLVWPKQSIALHPMKDVLAWIEGEFGLDASA